jgi:hypothetical protein
MLLRHIHYASGEKSNAYTQRKFMKIIFRILKFGINVCNFKNRFPQAQEYILHLKYIPTTSKANGKSVFSAHLKFSVGLFGQKHWFLLPPVLPSAIFRIIISLLLFQ